MYYLVFTVNGDVLYSAEQSRREYNTDLIIFKIWTHVIWGLTGMKLMEYG